MHPEIRQEGPGSCPICGMTSLATICETCYAPDADVSTVPDRAVNVSRAMSRMCKALGIEDPNLHDKRTAMTSWLDEAGVQESIQGSILHHAPRDVTSIHYRRSNRKERLRAAWQMWADYVQAKVSAQTRPMVSHALASATPNHAGQE